MSKFSQSEVVVVAQHDLMVGTFHSKEAHDVLVYAGLARGFDLEESSAGTHTHTRRTLLQKWRSHNVLLPILTDREGTIKYTMHDTVATVAFSHVILHCWCKPRHIYVYL